MIKWLKKLYCYQFHIWARVTIRDPRTDDPFILEEKCLTCGRVTVESGADVR